MEKMIVGVKAAIASIGAFLSAKLGLLYIILPLLMAVMIIDYLTGMLSAKKEGKTNSKTGMWGIVKKLLYGVEVATAMIVDWTIINVATNLGFNIPTVTFFGLLITIWLIINELISILENLTRLEVPMPAFLLKVVSNFKVVVESSGDNLANKIKNEKE
ncbi:phage holin family protein [Clostridium sp. HBUAS56017]|uniref:phage holin family protein n=1 Tax=Clostridium sp. HBUAS56017 TaxID=2571128 RepID=UPI0011782CC0|nr:phage holin family protein [Clostridium sp. HBUAS56017]